MDSVRAILRSPIPVFAMEAHDGISAKIAQRAGFRCLWASGLTISAALGHRDCNELSWTEVVNQASYIVNAANIPVLVDGDTGFGNFNNVRQLIKKLCRIGASGVCLEDKLFPKVNSFLDEGQELAPILEFVGKIKAAKDSQIDSEFSVIARTEAFIAGFGVEEALKRSYAYKEAGADALLIHSKKSTPAEIEEFCSHWDYSIPLVIAPTKYAPPSPELYRKLGVSLVIWANQLLRSAVYAMQEVAKRIQQDQSVIHLKESMISLDELFDLVDQSELEKAENKYSCKFL